MWQFVLQMEVFDVNINIADFYLNQATLDECLFVNLLHWERCDESMEFSMNVGSMEIRRSIDFLQDNPCLQDYERFWDNNSFHEGPKRLMSNPRSNIGPHTKKRPNSNPVNSYKAIPAHVPTQASANSGIPDDSFAECFLSGEKFFMCTQCTFKTRHRPSVNRHILCVHSITPPCFRCSTCGTSFKERFKLKCHYMKVHFLEEHVAKTAAGMVSR